MTRPARQQPGTGRRPRRLAARGLATAAVAGLAFSSLPAASQAAVEGDRLAHDGTRMERLHGEAPRGLTWSVARSTKERKNGQRRKVMRLIRAVVAAIATGMLCFVFVGVAGGTAQALPRQNGPGCSNELADLNFDRGALASAVWDRRNADAGFWESMMNLDQGRYDNCMNRSVNPFEDDV